MQDKYCSIYIKQEDEVLSSQEIEKQLKEGKVAAKIEALKALIINIINDDTFPRSVMTVINTLVPLQTETHDLKKVLLYYWEIIEKVKDNGDLKDEMILVCNSIRKDLLHPNEWVRGRTLRLVSRIMYRGVLEPLAGAIQENLEHKHVYVRRNAIVALNRIYLHFGEDLISDVDEMMEKILQNETDLSTKRNAFQLLFHSNQTKALEYLNNQIQNEANEEMGDILQLAVLELFRKSCKFDPSQKTRLLKAIRFFSTSKSNSVLIECANTLVQISNSNFTLNLATQIYLQILNTITDNNVKMIVLDKVIQIQKATQPKFLEEQISEITAILSNQSIDIRKKALYLIEQLTNKANIKEVFQTLVKEVKKAIHNTEESSEYLNLLFNTIIQFTAKFGDVLSEEALHLIIENLLTNTKLDDSQSDQVKEILIIVAQNNSELREILIQRLIQRFYDIQNLQLYKGTLWLIGEYCSNEDNIVSGLEEIKNAVGKLPIQEKQLKTIEESKQQEQSQESKKIKYKTVVLPDGTYGQEAIQENDVIDHHQDHQEDEFPSKFREFLMKHSNLASAMVRTLLRLLYKIRNNVKVFNAHGSQCILIFCSLLRYYSANKSKVDLDAVEKLNLGLRLITTPNLFLKGDIPWLNKSVGYLHPILQKQQITSAIALEQQLQQDKKKHIIAKQPDDVITIRGLKGKTVVGEIDIEDEEQNEDETLLKGVGDDQQDFVHKLGHLVQLTGFSDPIYAEAFVNIHKYDISFEVLLLNRTSKALQNVSCEFNTQGELRVLERAQPVTLQPNQSVTVKTSIKFTSQDIGLIFGNINYENMAGIEQAYLVTKEISIDLIDFIMPAEVNLNEYRKMWAKYEWENRITINTNINNLKEFVEHLEETFKLNYIGDKQVLEDAKYICANFYAQTKLDDDFLINLSAEIRDENRIGGYIRIRAKNKGIVVNLGDKIKLLQRKIE